MNAVSPPADLLAIRGLSIAYGNKPAVHDVDLTLHAGRSLALIGESGSGKSTIARALCGLLPASGTARGRILFQGQDLLALPEARLRALRGRAIGFVPQDPQNALNPVRSIGAQAQEAARLLDLPDVAARRARILQTFARIGLADPARLYDAYPHQLSGGMLQRVLIGLAILPGPALIVADEPTSALDVTIQKRILDLLGALQAELGISLLLITHDLAIAAERAHDVVVLKDGQVQERGTADQVFRQPRSAYARRLQADVPALNPERFRAATARQPGAGEAIHVDGVSKTFQAEGRSVRAVQDVSFGVPAGTTHALVGESGSGKTTLVRLLLGLERPDRGHIAVAGTPVATDAPDRLRGLRRELQLVYQNPFTSLDPTWSVGGIIAEPLQRYDVGHRGDRQAQVIEALRAVDLPEQVLRRRPGALSGGQRQRVAIARALILRPKVLVLDEPTSALDVTVQAGIVEVLFRLQAQLGLTYLFVSHDLALIRQLADSVTVLRHGQVVEQGPVAQIFSRPREAYTRLLLDSIPRPAAASRESFLVDQETEN
ncbi:ABC transporter ATP-binding protein [Roseomonas sp. 18066]|uniref:dipeptide ABC transporter ATP-binding protein n=1 Tax=Roseomonas sp. 18066 TaxID=2681412 RepID=UPI0013591318|nr:ABC transporter ATP-binding protein [Roseomonas sp. 18066]